MIGSETRRSLLRQLAATTAASSLAGCQLFVKPLRGFSPSDPRFTDMTTHLGIDAHAHIFNGSDLQVGPFLKYVVLPGKPGLQGLTPILEAMEWDTAPAAADELQAIKELKLTKSLFSFKSLKDVYRGHSQRAHKGGVDALRRAANKAKSGLGPRGQSLAPSVESQINALPDDYEEYKSKLKASPLGPRVTGDISIGNAIHFLLRGFQYRYVNVFDYLSTYSEGHDRKIDLLVVHMVDYDWPIGGGQPTQTSLADQVTVMEEISIVTGGRVHYFVPFCPMKEVAFRLGKEKNSSLAFVKAAFANNRGAIGIKMYPPMGFAPIGNTPYNGFWNAFEWFPTDLKIDDLGSRLDQVLLELYSWCRSENVPIMAHTASSNSPGNSNDYYTRFLNPAAWSGLPAGVHVNFGHFGDTDEVEHAQDPTKPSRAKAFADLMTADAGSVGQFFYADSAYFAECLTEADKLQSVLNQLLQSTAGKGAAALSQRLMYGTDWEMVIIEGSDTDKYLTDFEQIIGNLDTSSRGLADRFFGLNAAEFLALRNARVKGNRQRLEQFYAIHKVPKPMWMKKIDASAAVA